MSPPRLDPTWFGFGAAGIVLVVAAVAGFRAYGRRARRRALLNRLQRIAFESARRVAGLIFGGDQMSEWTVMARGRRYTFDNPQPALYDRIAAVKALVGDIPVEGRLLFSNVGKFTKGMPKWVLMLDGMELEFPVVERTAKDLPVYEAMAAAWSRLRPQLRPSPHTVTSL
jgi:hypothetical protein